MTKARKKRHEHDAWVRRARNEGYRSRAVYKLSEIDQRDKLFRPGLAVLDIGAAPGSWCQYAVSRVGASGRVVGVDMEEIEPLPGAVFVRCNISGQSAHQLCRDALGGGCDLVICDVAPHITGIACSDQARMEELLLAALDLSMGLLRPGGGALFKVFSGSAGDSFRSRLGRCFARVSTRKPAASRPGSSEFYLWCQSYTGRVRL